MKDEKLKTITAGAFLMMSIGLAGCNTIEGAGEDIQSAGEAIEEEAED